MSESETASGTVTLSMIALWQYITICYHDIEHDCIVTIYHHLLQWHWICLHCDNISLLVTMTLNMVALWECITACYNDIKHGCIVTMYH